jgi:hypothetical protein
MRSSRPIDTGGNNSGLFLLAKSHNAEKLLRELLKKEPVIAGDFH